jgi:hypothetical protein
VEDLGLAGDGGHALGVVLRQVDGELERAALVEAPGGREHHMHASEVVLIGKLDGDLAVGEGLEVGGLELLEDRLVQCSRHLSIVAVLETWGLEEGCVAVCLKLV